MDFEEEAILYIGGLGACGTLIGGAIGGNSVAYVGGLIGLALGILGWMRRTSRLGKEKRK